MTAMEALAQAIARLDRAAAALAALLPPAPR